MRWKGGRGAGGGLVPEVAAGTPGGQRAAFQADFIVPKDIIWLGRVEPTLGQGSPGTRPLRGPGGLTLPTELATPAFLRTLSNFW